MKMGTWNEEDREVLKKIENQLKGINHSLRVIARCFVQEDSSDDSKDFKTLRENFSEDAYAFVNNLDFLEDE